MANLFTGISLVTLQEALVSAQNALLKLERGESVSSIGSEDGTISFTAANPSALRRHIKDLQLSIAIASGQRPINSARPSIARWRR